MTSGGHTLNKQDCIFASGNMDIVVHTIIHLDHFVRESDTASFYYQPGAIDIKNLVLIEKRLTRERQLHYTGVRRIGGFYNVLTSLIDIEDRTK